MKRMLRYSLYLLATALAAAGPGVAQEDSGSGPAETELRQAMQRYFQNRLRAELSLSDEQLAEIAPKIERIEQTRNEARRERSRTMQQLRRGLHEGAADAELQSLLDHLEQIETEQRQSEKSLVGQIDEQLNVRQRVQFRFVVMQFRREMQRRIQQLRRQRLGDPDSGPQSRRLPEDWP